jgi:TPR repeat protein
MNQTDLSDLIDKGMDFYEQQDYVKAFEIFQETAKSNNAIAQHMLAICYYYGHGVEINKSSALFWFREASDKSFAKSLMMAGLMLMNGEGIEKSIDESLLYLEKAARSDDAYSCRLLGGIFAGEINEFESKTDLPKAIEYFEMGANLEDAGCMQRLAYFINEENLYSNEGAVRALELNVRSAELGNTDAAFNAGLAYVHGRGAEVNIDKAFKWYKAAASAGVVLAQHNLGALYMNSGTDLDSIEAHYWYLQAAKKGSFLSQNCLGHMYFFGQGVEKNLVIALSWFLLASRDGKHIESAEYVRHLKAELNPDQISEAELISSAFDREVQESPIFQKKNIEKSVDAGAKAFKDGFYARALSELFYPAQQGDRLSCRYLGIIYRYGLDVQVNFIEALKWFDQAAYLGDVVAQFQIAEIYQQGLGVKPDPVIALKYFKLAANANHAEANYFAGMMLLNGDGPDTNLNDCIKYLDRAAHLDLVDAQLTLAELYLFGKDENLIDYEKAAFWFLKAAEKNHPVALNDLGNMHAFGMFFEKNIDAAFDFYRRAADYGGGAGQFNYGRHLLARAENEEDFEKAISCLDLAAEGGYTKAQIHLGMMYVEGNGVNVDHSLAFKYFSQAANSGSAEGFTCLGMNYANGYGCEINHEISSNLFRQAADLGSAQGQFNIGWNYQYGIGVEKDHDQAFKYYQLASDQNHPAGIRGLGEILEGGTKEISQDVSRAFELYLRASELNDFVADYNLGVFYMHGTVVEVDKFKAAFYLERAASKGHDSAMFNLGILHQEGINGLPDYQKAMSFFEAAAGHGHLKALGSIGSLFLNGLGVDKDVQKAISFFEKSAGEGEIYSQYNLGLIYRLGDDIDQDYVKAAYWFAQAASRGLSGAQLDLAILLLQGYGVDQDIAEAYKWTLISEMSGDERAVKLKVHFFENFDESVLIEGKKRMQDYLMV